MATMTYEAWTPVADARAIVRIADTICTDYAAQGYDLTLRQLYYQFVARGHIPNNQAQYNRLGTIVAKARMAGMLDWSYIVDRTRNLQKLAHWRSPGGVIASAARSYNRDLWVDQPERVEVWVEKEALAGVVDRAASAWDCSWFSCRGYVSLSEMHAAAQRIGAYIEDRQRVTILHLGDHDPSGIDMTRDVQARLELFIATDYANNHPDDFNDDDDPQWVLEQLGDELGGPPLTINRIALNRDQVDRYQPPPNPAKLTDSRAAGYIAAHGRSSWELDALDPATLDALIQDHINRVLQANDTVDAYFAQRDRVEHERELLTGVANGWDRVADWWQRQ